MARRCVWPGPLPWGRSGAALRLLWKASSFSRNISKVNREQTNLKFKRESELVGNKLEDAKVIR